MKIKKRRRIIPFTTIGIRRIKCIRCGKKASQQWQICSDDNQFRPICIPCDIALNQLVLRFIGLKDWKMKISIYTEKLNREKRGNNET